MADKFIGDYIGAMSEATADEIKNGVVMVRTASGEMKQAPGNKLGEKAVFEAIYGVTTYAEISAAIEAGQAVVCVSHGNVHQLDGTVTATGYTFTRNWKDENGKVYSSFTKVDSADDWTNKNVEVAKAADIPENAVSSTDVTAIVKVFALPENPDPNTLYLVIEEDAAAASETEVE